MTPIKLASIEHPSQLAFDDGVTRITYAELENFIVRACGLKQRPDIPGSTAQQGDSDLTLTDEAGELEIPFAESIVNPFVRQMANLHPGDHVAWCPRNDLEALMMFWAFQQRGCVTCPISDRFPIETRKEIVRRIDAQWVPGLLTKDLKDSPKAAASPSNRTDDRQRPATIILSSGTTGAPKAIVHTLAAHIENATGAATNMPLGPGDRWLWSLPLCHVSGMSILIRCAVAGATVVGLQGDTSLTAGLLHQRKITHLSVVATQLRRLMADEQFPSPHLKSVLLGGGSVDEALVTAARKRGVALSTTYGLTEMGSQVTTSKSADDPATSGRVLPGRELKIDSSGEILVRGRSLCLGYYTDQKIEPVVDEDGWFHTKDLGTLDDQQQLSVKGRIDNMFVSGGENIHPESIQRAMMSLFAVDQIVVLPRADDTFGRRPVAFVQGDLPADWEATLRTRLQGFEIPVEILTWPEDVESSIKPDRKKLQQIVDRSS